MTASAQILVAGVELSISQDGDSVSITRVVGKDRTLRPPRAVTGGVTLSVAGALDPPAIAIVRALNRVAQLATARCTCDYRYGYSDHADSCRSIYVARSDDGGGDDD